MRAALMRCSVALAVAGVASFATSADAKGKKKPRAEDDVVDTSGFKKGMIVLTDGEDTLIAAEPKWTDDKWVFYSNDGGKTFWQQRVGSASQDDGQGTFSRRFWSPRVEGVADLDGKTGGKYLLTCGHSEVPLTKLDDVAAQKLLAKAAFHKPQWKRQAHALARDDRGNYYYVDRFRDELGGKGHRIFAGPKGALKELPMTNIVSDSMGEIYATKNGELRFINSTSAASWIKGPKSTALTIVPVEDNVAMIYGDLGVYVGSLGTPCDDYEP